MSDQDTVAHMEQVWSAIIALCSTLTEREWKTPTDCPGWTVQDQVAHMLGSESRLLGLPTPEHTPPDTSHVKTSLASATRSGWTGTVPGLGPRYSSGFRK